MSGCLILRSGVEFLPFIKLWLLQNMWNVWILHRWLLFCKKNTEKCWEIFWVGRYKIWDTAIGTTCRIFSILLLISIGGKLYLEISFSHGRPASNSWELYRPSFYPLSLHPFWSLNMKMWQWVTNYSELATPEIRYFIKSHFLHLPITQAFQISYSSIQVSVDWPQYLFCPNIILCSLQSKKYQSSPLKLNFLTCCNLKCLFVWLDLTLMTNDGIGFHP